MKTFEEIKNKRVSEFRAQVEAFWPDDPTKAELIVGWYVIGFDAGACVQSLADVKVANETT